MSDSILQKLAAEALQIQDACNLCALVGRFDEVLKELHRHPQCKGTDWINHHPVTLVWLDKLCDLSGLPRTFPDAAYNAVYDWAERKNNGRDDHH